jgi:hypothetical protein
MALANARTGCFVPLWSVALLQSKSERVLVELAGERAPLPPNHSIGFANLFPRTIETLEKMPFAGQSPGDAGTYVKTRRENAIRTNGKSPS